MSVIEINLELDAVHTARLKIMENVDKAVSYTIGGRQISVVGPNALEVLDRHEKYLNNALTKAERLEAGYPAGMRVRYGNVR